MFTGIVKIKGKVAFIDTKKEFGVRIGVETPELADYHLGGSILNNGVCLTVVEKDGNILFFDVIHETLDKTNLGKLKIGDTINLEPSLTLQTLMDGHLAFGHVDFVSKLIEINAKNEFYFELPSEFVRFVALKGSIGVNGVSLTVSELTNDSFKVSLIPATLEMTNLGELKIGDTVNIEIDMIARYVERLMQKDLKE